MRAFVAPALMLAVLGLSAATSVAAEPAAWERTQDVVYGRKHGTALTMDVFVPKGPRNGAAVVYVVSGGWFSAHAGIQPPLLQAFLDRGYTVFAVVHGSQPKFAIPEIIEDLHRAVRFIRHNAKRYEIDPERIGITGGSAGGHLSLMIATSGTTGPADAKDPIDRASSRVQAVACFFPPTDFLNYGEPDRTILEALRAELQKFRAPFDFKELDRETGRLVFVRGRERRLAIAREISPVTHVSPDDPPTLILHGDQDKLVPLQQSERMKEKLESAGVPVELVVVEGHGHGWPNWVKDIERFAAWFDRYLVAEGAREP